MFRVLSNQHYQHRTNQKLRSWANAVFQNRGVCGQAFPSFPSPSPVIPFFFLALVPPFLDELARKRLLRTGYVSLLCSFHKRQHCRLICYCCSFGLLSGRFLSIFSILWCILSTTLWCTSALSLFAFVLEE